MKTQYAVLKPINLRGKVCKNRIIMAAHSYGYADSSGLPTDYLVAYLEERAKGGCGLVIMGGTAVSQDGALPLGNITRSLDDRIIPWYQQIARAVHQHGGLIFDQLMHAGGLLRAREGVSIVAPSAIPHERTRGMPIELTLDGIRRLIGDFTQAAIRAEKGGLDGIELKCDQGFLIHQFLSPYFNRRNDAYGGDAERRQRFLFEVLEGIRRSTSPDLIVGVRIAGDSLFKGDLTLEDALKLASELERTELIDYIHVNGATNSTFLGYLQNHGDASIEAGNFVHYAKRIKQNVSLPVIAASMVTHPLMAEEVVLSGAADMVAMTRSHIADPEIVTKLNENRIDEIRPCVLLNQGCVGNHYPGFPVRCVHNPATGRERELGMGTIRRTHEPKSIAVIGGGVAGMEVARVAALRGNTVHLFEKQKQLGGQLLLASKVPFRQGLLDIARHLEHEISRLKVAVYLGEEIQEGTLQSLTSGFDSFVIATGSEPCIPENYSHIDINRSFTIKDVLSEKVLLGEHIVIFEIDWRQNALSLAEWLVQRGHRVTIVSTAFFAGDGLDVVTLSSCYSRLSGKVLFLPLMDLYSYNNRVVTLRHILSNALTTLSSVDQIVFVTGSTPSKDLYDSIGRELGSVFLVGDSASPMGIPEAMLAANRLGRVL